MSWDNSDRFPTTQWTGVERAGQPDTIGKMALGQLLEGYLGPMRTHLVLSHRIREQQADDLLQGFISSQILEKDLIAGADPKKGRFRTYLLVALNRFVSNALRDAHRHNRRLTGDAQAMQDAADAPDPAPSPADAFEIAWARQVLAQAADRMHELCLATIRPDVWRVFEARILGPTIDGADPVPYEGLVTELSLTSAHAASNLVITAKRMFARSLRGVVGEYTDEATQIDQEVAELREILSRDR